MFGLLDQHWITLKINKGNKKMTNFNNDFDRWYQSSETQSHFHEIQYDIEQVAYSAALWAYNKYTRKQILPEKNTSKYDSTLTGEINHTYEI